MANPGNGLWMAESDSGDNDDWITDHSGDPEDLDYSQFTEGDDILTFIDFYGTVEQAPSFKADYEDIPGWTHIDVSIEEGHDLFKVIGTFQASTFTLTQEKENLLQSFFREHSYLGDNIAHLIRRWDEDLYKKFPNASRTLKKYVPMKFTKPPVTKIVQRVLEFSFVVRSGW